MKKKKSFREGSFRRPPFAEFGVGARSFADINLCCRVGRAGVPREARWISAAAGVKKVYRSEVSVQCLPGKPGLPGFLSGGVLLDGLLFPDFLLQGSHFLPQALKFVLVSQSLFPRPRSRQDRGKKFWETQDKLEILREDMASLEEAVREKKTIQQNASYRETRRPSLPGRRWTLTSC